MGLALLGEGDQVTTAGQPVMFTLQESQPVPRGEVGFTSVPCSCEDHQGQLLCAGGTKWPPRHWGRGEAANPSQGCRTGAAPPKFMELWAPLLGQAPALQAVWQGWHGLNSSWTLSCGSWENGVGGE